MLGPASKINCGFSYINTNTQWLIVTACIQKFIYKEPFFFCDTDSSLIGSTYKTNGLGTSAFAQNQNDNEQTRWIMNADVAWRLSNIGHPSVLHGGKGDVGSANKLDITRFRVASECNYHPLDSKTDIGVASNFFDSVLYCIRVIRLLIGRSVSFPFTIPRNR